MALADAAQRLLDLWDIPGGDFDTGAADPLFEDLRAALAGESQGPGRAEILAVLGALRSIVDDLAACACAEPGPGCAPVLDMNALLDAHNALSWVLGVPISEDGEVAEHPLLYALDPREINALARQYPDNDVVTRAVADFNHRSQP